MGWLWGIALARRDVDKVPLSWKRMGAAQWLLHGLYDFAEMELALDLVCAGSIESTQIAVSVLVAALFTAGCAVVAGRQYSKLKESRTGPGLVSDQYSMDN